MSRRDRRQGRGRTELGFTLVEMMVTSALILIVLAMVLPQLATTLTGFDDARVRSETTDQAQLALDQVQHDVSASNVLYIDSGTPPLVHLQSYSSGNTSTCIEYQVTTAGVLQRRTKAPVAAWPAATTGWSNVMTGIVNSSRPAPAPAVFAISQNRSLTVVLWVNTDTRTHNQAKPSEFTSTVTGSAIPQNSSSTSGPC